MTAAVPPIRDRLAGRYFSQCPSCRTHRVLGPCCGGSGAVPAKTRRQAERRALRRCVDDELGTTPRDPFLDQSDCIHGGAGAPGCSEQCTFVCHGDEAAGA